MKGRYAKYFLKLFMMLIIFWFLLSGRFELKFILYGIAAAVICSFVCMPLLLIQSEDGKKEYFVFDVSILKMIGYSVWIFGQLIVSNFSLVKAVASPVLKINPKVVRFRVSMENPMALTVLANSITLTPGTVTMNVTKDGVYEVHALTDAAAAGIAEGGMQRRVARMFGQDESFFMLAEE